MREINEKANKQDRPVKILQFGEGNFLRAFADYMVDVANEKGVFNGDIVIAKPIEYGNLSAFHEQGCVYRVLLRGKNGTEERKVTSVAQAVDCYSQFDAFMACAKNPDLRFVISNTTEAGIVYDETDELDLTPPKSYPGKLTRFLYERFKAGLNGLIILPVELIENNGQKLRECCLRLAQKWGLDTSVINQSIFCRTLVDRIVTGYEAGHGDKLFVTGEPFALWVIESDQIDLVRDEFPLDQAGLPVIFTDNLTPYRERKVRILNGAHTSTVLAAHLAGLETVGELMADRDMRMLLEQTVYGELAPCVALPKAEVESFADSVMERFENPFIRHELLSIALNSVSKWKARVLPSVRDTLNKTGKLPPALCFSLAALIQFYRGGFDRDDKPVIEFFAANKSVPAGELTEALLKRGDFWGEDLNALPGFTETVSGYLQVIREKGVRKAIQDLLSHLEAKA